MAEIAAKRDTFEEELAMYENQDRAIREKCTQLEHQMRRMDQKQKEMQRDADKMLRVEKELVAERDALLAKLHDTGYQADKYFDELRKTKDMNEREVGRNRTLTKKIA